MAVNREQMIDMIDALPEEDKELVYNLVRKLVVAWDPDYKKLTPREKQQLMKGKKEIENGDFVKYDEIDWDK